jgi:hypothetical protein
MNVQILTIKKASHNREASFLLIVFIFYKEATCFAKPDLRFAALLA